MKKILIVFYSRGGNTGRAATDIASALGADIEELIDKKNRRGILGFITAGIDATKKNLTKIAPLGKNPADYDLVIIGSPVWGSNMTPAVRTFFNQNREKIGQYAFFITSGDTDPELMAKSATEIIGKSPVASTGWNAKELADKPTYENKLALFTSKIKRDFS